jgi:hypothetical protein
VDGQQLLVAASPAEFAQRVIDVYRDEALWTRLSAAGRQHIEQHLGYEAVRVSVGAMLNRAAAGRPGSGS